MAQLIVALLDAKDLIARETDDITITVVEAPFVKQFPLFIKMINPNRYEVVDECDNNLFFEQTPQRALRRIQAYYIEVVDAANTRIKELRGNNNLPSLGRPTQEIIQREDLS